MWPSNAGSGPKTGKFAAAWAKKRQFSALTAKFGLKITCPQQLDVRGGYSAQFKVDEGLKVPFTPAFGCTEAPRTPILG